MDQRKRFIVDTNVLLEDPACIRKLRNGLENDVLVPYHVLPEFNKLKKGARLARIAAKVARNLLESRDQYAVLDTDKVAEPFQDLVDGYITGRGAKKRHPRADPGHQRQAPPAPGRQARHQERVPPRVRALSLGYVHGASASSQKSASNAAPSGHLSCVEAQVDLMSGSESPGHKSYAIALRIPPPRVSKPVPIC